MGTLIALLSLLGLATLWLARRWQAETGLPPGRVVYLDTETLGRQQHPLYDPAIDLSGRPDYLVEREGRLVPVEIKSGRAPVQPYPSHVYQLAAYCLLVEANFGHRPPYGIVKYDGRTFAIDYTEGLEDELLDILAAMRRAEGRELDRSHESPWRCRACGYRQACDQRLS